MGVKGLWPLLEPVGRRISIEALQNKRLAVGEASSLSHNSTAVSRLSGEPAAALLANKVAGWRSPPLLLASPSLSSASFPLHFSAVTLHAPHPAADASIWLFQFIQAMRDERGDLIRNAHVLGFFRRICRCGCCLAWYRPPARLLLLAAVPQVSI